MERPDGPRSSIYRNAGTTAATRRRPSSPSSASKNRGASAQLKGPPSVHAFFFLSLSRLKLEFRKGRRERIKKDWIGNEREEEGEGERGR